MLPGETATPSQADTDTHDHASATSLSVLSLLASPCGAPTPVGHAVDLALCCHPAARTARAAGHFTSIADRAGLYSATEPPSNVWRLFCAASGRQATPCSDLLTIAPGDAHRLHIINGRILQLDTYAPQGLPHPPRFRPYILAAAGFLSHQQPLLADENLFHDQNDQGSITHLPGM